MGEIYSDSIRESRQSGKYLHFTQEDMPWLDESLKVPLALITLNDGGQYFLGSAIRGKTLVEAANKLNDYESNLASKHFLDHLPLFFTIGSSDIYRVEVPKSSDPMFYVKISGGNKTRTMFIRPKNIKEIPVVVKVAVCRKQEELDVLKKLTFTDKRK